MRFEILIIFHSRIAVPSNLGDLIEQDLLKSINVVLSGEPKNGEKSSRLEGRDWGSIPIEECFIRWRMEGS